MSATIGTGGLSLRRGLYAAVCCVGAAVFSCEVVEPEITVVNRTAEHILIANPSFNGATWRAVLRYGQATSPARCLRGSDHVHFQTLDAHAYCRTQASYGQLDSVCMCDTAWMRADSGIVSGTPMLFNYRTVSRLNVDYGDFIVMEITLDNMEQDFSVPGPYGH